VEKWVLLMGLCFVLRQSVALFLYLLCKCIRNVSAVCAGTQDQGMVSMQLDTRMLQ
jgi:hypothetical protein